jgi:hypothetical protein
VSVNAPGRPALRAPGRCSHLSDPSGRGKLGKGAELNAPACEFAGCDRFVMYTLQFGCSPKSLEGKPCPDGGCHAASTLANEGLRCEHVDEIELADPAIAVHISFDEKLVNLFRRQLVA